MEYFINEKKNDIKVNYTIPKYKLQWTYFDHIYPTPPLGQDMTQGQFFKRGFIGLNSEFSFS